jgi:hypothetical protein
MGRAARRRTDQTHRQRMTTRAIRREHDHIRRVREADRDAEQRIRTVQLVLLHVFDLALRAGGIGYLIERREAA